MRPVSETVESTKTATPVYHFASVIFYFAYYVFILCCGVLRFGCVCVCRVKSGRIWVCGVFEKVAFTGLFVGLRHGFGKQAFKIIAMEMSLECVVVFI